MRMAKMIIFKDPALAHELREAGFAVFRQQYNGAECFAVEQTNELQMTLPTMKARFADERFAISRTLHF